LFKQKNDLHAEVKKLEQEKAEEINTYNSNNPKENNEKIEKEVNELKR